MRDYAERIEKKDALQAHPEYLNEQINDHDKAIYAKGWNDCNKEYYNAITELPVASIACTDLSMRLRRTFEADELVNQRILLDAADAIEELIAERDDWETIAKHKSKIIKKMESEQSKIMQQLPTWVSVVEERLPEIGEIVLAYVDELRLIIRAKIVDAKDYRGERRIDWARVDPDPFFLSCYTITHWMPLPAPPKGVE